MIAVTPAQIPHTIRAITISPAIRLRRTTCALVAI
jgi:hypothetical protein